MAIRNDGAAPSDIQQQFTDFAALPIAIDSIVKERAWTFTVALADHQRLTVYDAAYLELAIRRDPPLATLDRKLAVAARAEGVEVNGG